MLRVFDMEKGEAPTLNLLTGTRLKVLRSNSAPDRARGRPQYHKRERKMRQP